MLPVPINVRYQYGAGIDLSCLVEPVHLWAPRLACISLGKAHFVQKRLIFLNPCSVFVSTYSETALPAYSTLSITNTAYVLAVTPVIF